MKLEHNETIVIGHKNPDTDSICSAIAYAYLKNQISEKKYTAKRAGEIGGDTKFVLDKFHVPIPEYIENVSSQVSDIELKKVEGVEGNLTLRRAYSLMMEKNAFTLAITEEGKILKGLITIGDIASSDMDVYDNRIISKANTPYKNIIDTLDGTMIIGDENAYFNTGKVLIAAANPDLMESYIDKGDMVIMGNRFESQFLAIEMNAGCIVVCVGAEVPATIQRVAREKGCMIISTPHDTFTTARLINQSMPIEYFMTKDNLATVHMEEYTKDIKEVMVKLRHRYFPVLDSNDHYCGMISKRSFIGIEKKKVILVDHNEKSQAVDGIEDANVLEIIDHHRLGNLETMLPVFFRNEPVGSTATIVTKMFEENNIEIPPDIAGILCAAILSDTLVYRSPTCTAYDKQVAQKLAQIAGIEVESFASDMFCAGSDLKNKPTNEIFYRDFKTFSTEGITFGVGQVTSMNQSELDEIKQRVEEYMQTVLAQQAMDMVLFMLTNIMEESTELIFCGPKAKELVLGAFECTPKESSVYLKGVVSRKKQLVPAIIDTLQR